MVFGRCGALLPLFRHVGVRCVAALRRGKCLLRHRSDRPKLEKMCFTVFQQLFAVVQYTKWCVAGSPQDVRHLCGGSAYLTHRNVALPEPSRLLSGCEGYAPFQWWVVTSDPLRGRSLLTADKKRLAAAFAVAAISDGLSFWLVIVPPLQWAVDLVTALLLFLLLGRKWVILPGLIAEAIPGLNVFPFWLLVVGSIATWGSIRRPPAKP